MVGFISSSSHNGFIPKGDLVGFYGWFTRKIETGKGDEPNLESISFFQVFSHLWKTQGPLAKGSPGCLGKIRNIWNYTTPSYTWDYFMVIMNEIRIHIKRPGFHAYPWGGRTVPCDFGPCGLHAEDQSPWRRGMFGPGAPNFPKPLPVGSDTDWSTLTNFSHKVQIFQK